MNSLVRMGFAVASIAATLSIDAPARAASASANVAANVINGSSAVVDQNLSFGDLTAGTTAGFVTVAANGTRTTLGGPTLLASTFQPAIFHLAGQKNASFSYNLSNPPALSDGNGHTMLMVGFDTDASGTKLDKNGNATVTVGGTLFVNAGQSAGTYTGTITIIAVLH